MIRHFLCQLTKATLPTFLCCFVSMSMQDIDTEEDIQLDLLSSRDSLLLPETPEGSLEMSYENKDRPIKKIYNKNSVAYKVGKVISTPLRHPIPTFFFTFVPAGFYELVMINLSVTALVHSSTCLICAPACCCLTASCCVSCEIWPHNCLPDDCIAAIYHSDYQTGVERSLRKLQNLIGEWDNKPIYSENIQKMSQLFVAYVSKKYDIALDWEAPPSEESLQSYYLEPLEQDLCLQMMTKTKPVKTLRSGFFNDPSTDELQYRWHLHKELIVLKKTMDEWEKKKNQLIQAFCQYILDNHKVTLIWSHENDENVMESLKASLYSTFKGSKKSTIAEEIFLDFYNNEKTKPFALKNLEVFDFFKKQSR